MVLFSFGKNMISKLIIVRARSYICIRIMKKFTQLTVLLCLLGSTIYLCLRNYSLHQEVKFLEQHNSSIGATKTDTVFLDKSFTEDKELPLAVVPSKVTYYSQPTKVDTTKSQTSNINLVQFQLTRDLLKLTTTDSSSKTATTEFAIDLSKYRYLYSGNTNAFTAKKISGFSVKPYLEYKLRLPNTFNDLSGGIQIKTKSFNYKLGIDVAYYPTLSKKLYKDLELSFIYNF